MTWKYSRYINCKWTFVIWYTFGMHFFYPNTSGSNKANHSKVTRIKNYFFKVAAWIATLQSADTLLQGGTSLIPTGWMGHWTEDLIVPEQVKNTRILWPLLSILSIQTASIDQHFFLMTADPNLLKSTLKVNYKKYFKRNPHKNTNPK